MNSVAYFRDGIGVILPTTAEIIVIIALCIFLYALGGAIREHSIRIHGLDSRDQVAAYSAENIILKKEVARLKKALIAKEETINAVRFALQDKEQETI